MNGDLKPHPPSVTSNFMSSVAMRLPALSRKCDSSLPRASETPLSLAKVRLPSPLAGEGLGVRGGTMHPSCHAPCREMFLLPANGSDRGSAVSFSEALLRSAERVSMDGHPGLTRSRDSAVSWVHAGDAIRVPALRLR